MNEIHSRGYNKWIGSPSIKQEGSEAKELRRDDAAREDPLHDKTVSHSGRSDLRISGGSHAAYGKSTAVLMHLPRRALEVMNRVLNSMLRTGHFPETWKKSKVITIPKAEKDPRRPENLRTITLILHVAKTFERALLRKLRPFLSPRQKQ
ncbi:RNA-directed DNA polymerase from mobile element jockey [Eumeta japonica]|uniref:RNA-directed DNA polymerase from mobile element jockey n=1 Tax=Eumeta variegata TaxID=151549 RepID=A0A4C1TUU3_EUMVA|nr:RNA-directed DNA polymerase from mobile element jockey [Eumeta japonica]